MAIEEKEINIDGVTWRLNKLPTTKGVECLAQLAPFIGSLMANQGADGTAALQIIASNMAKPGVAKTIRDLVDSGLSKNFKPVEYEMEFADNYLVLFKLAKFAMEINFRNFFTGLSTLLGSEATTPALPVP